MNRDLGGLRWIVISMVFIVLIPYGLHGQSEDGNIYLPEDFPEAYITISEIEVTGNERTKEKIIIRELDFSLGDSLATFDDDLGKFSMFSQKRISRSDSSEVVKRMKYSRENIINTQLFLSADLRLEQSEGERYTLKIDVNERWYFWVFPVVKLDHPNFNDWIQDPDLDQVNMGLFTSHNNMWGLSHQASAAAYLGSSQLFALGYKIPWIGNGQKIGMVIGAAYKNSAVVEYASIDNERQMIYDQGSVEEILLTNTFTFRPGLYNYGKIRMDAGFVSISDSLFSLTQEFLPDNKSQVSFVNFYGEYTYDSRNNRAYPLRGNYLKAFVDKRGMGIISHDVDYFYYGVDLHFYQKISDRWYAAEMAKLVSSSSENVPYYFQQTLTSGRDFIRGYDYYALSGDRMYYFRSNLKYNVIKPGVMKARKEKNKDSKFRNVPYAFYVNLLADAAYVVDDFRGYLNPYNNKMLYTWGLGVDFISYYDLVLRFEYAFTNIGTHGFFFGFGMPI